MADAPKLLPCPFCGRDDMLLMTSIPPLDEVFMACNSCGSRGPEAYDDLKAAGAWNTRAAPDVSALVEAGALMRKRCGPLAEDGKAWDAAIAALEVKQ